MATQARTASRDFPAVYEWSSLCTVCDPLQDAKTEVQNLGLLTM